MLSPRIDGRETKSSFSVGWHPLHGYILELDMNNSSDRMFRVGRKARGEARDMLPNASAATTDAFAAPRHWPCPRERQNENAPAVARALDQRGGES